MLFSIYELFYPLAGLSSVDFISSFIGISATASCLPLPGVVLRQNGQNKVLTTNGLCLYRNLPAGWARSMNGDCLQIKPLIGRLCTHLIHQWQWSWLCTFLK